MKISLVSRAAPLDRRKALACLILNVGACPGLGSVLAGRLSGWPQLGLAVVGFCLIVKEFLLFIIALVKAGHLPHDWRHHLASLGLGLGLFGLAWLWSGITGLLVLRSVARKTD